MNILRRLLDPWHGKPIGITPEKRVKNGTDSPNQVPGNVPEELFIEREIPAPEARIARVPTRLQQMAAQDRSEEGRRAGFQYHDMDLCAQMKEGIKAAILRELEMEFERIGQLIDELDVELRRLNGGGMEVTMSELQARRNQMNHHRMRLHEQRMLVPGNSGYAELPLTTFETGFKQGYRDYLDATGLITKYQG